MSYRANQYNYATPLSSALGVYNEHSVVNDVRYFTLHDNALDGSCIVISGDVGLWGSSVSDANGVLNEPFVVTVEEPLLVSAFRLTSSSDCYPVDFIVEFYNGDNLEHSLIVTDNTEAERVIGLPNSVNATHYVLTITKVSKPGSVARVYNIFVPPIISRSDNIKVSLEETTNVVKATYITSTDRVGIKLNEQFINALVHSTSDTLVVRSTDFSGKSLTNTHIAVQDRTAVRVNDYSNITLTREALQDSVGIRVLETSHIINTIDTATDIISTDIAVCSIEDISHILNTINVTTDELSIEAQDEAELINIHSVMKQPFRQVFGKVYVTYADPMLDTTSNGDASSTAYNSNVEQLADDIHITDGKYFTLYDNDLSGDYMVSGSDTQVGWTSDQLSDENGYFNEDVWITLTFEPRPIKSLLIAFDTSHDNLVKDFNVILTKSDFSLANYEFVDNNESIIEIAVDLAEIQSVTVMVRRVSRPFSPATILSIPLSSTILYRGYKDESELMSIDLLEELTYEDEVEALGGVSANMVTVVFDNSNRNFYFNNENSLVSRQLRRNRKIIPWLGAEINPGEIEWYNMGTFWSYKWNVSVNGLTASVVGFDTIGLLDTTSFTQHQLLMNKSLGELIEYVLADARLTLNFIEYVIDPALYDIVIPYAWFEPKSHTAALRKISRCFPMHIYCDREGRICAAPQKLHLDYYYDVWSDNTNVINKTYDSLYTTLPNVINVTTIEPHVIEDEQLVSDNYVASVADKPTRVLAFNKPYISDINVSIDCDSTVNYSYEVFSWGINITFSGYGVVRLVECFGTALDISNTSVMTYRNDESVLLNGAVTRDVQADFIQTSSLASTIINRIVSLSQADKYDVSVDYRGDIALTINDPILLEGGIAPDNRYNIKRHQLTWDGHLTGSADLNT